MLQKEKANGEWRIASRDPILHSLLAIRLLAVSGALITSACTLGPDFLPPKADTPAGWTDTAIAPKGASVALPVEPSSDAWWQSFRDPELTSLISRAGAANLDLKEAALRISESRFQQRITAAAELPSLDANTSYSTNRYSTKTAQGSLYGALGSIKGPPGFVAPNLPNPYNQFQVGFDAAWEPDLFGGIKRSEEAASADTEAAVEQHHDALVSLEAEVARAYLDLRGTQLKLSITNANLRTQRDTVSLTRDRVRAQLGNDLDASNANAQLTATQAQLPLLQREIDSDVNQLSLLLAREPGALHAELKTAQAVPPVPPQVPIGLPGDLARRRPDIRAAEARLHAATARVGVAVADLYPKVQFDAPFGTQAQRIPDLASWAAVFFQMGPTVTIPVFEGGRLRATVHLQETQEKEAAVDYAKTVLGAIHEIENALVVYSTEQQHRQALAATVVENRRALALAQQRYRDGLTTFLDVLETQRSLLAAQLSLAESTQAVSTDLVALYKALGGGWQTGESAPAGK
jgi:NodT family efflux transporter outer membrane factor (OMF) lipoprotein